MIAAIDVIERRLRAPARTGAARTGRALLQGVLAIPRRTRALLLGASLFALLALLLASMPEPERTASAPVPTNAFVDAAPAPAPATAIATDAGDAGAQPDATDPLAQARLARLQRAADLIAR